MSMPARLLLLLVCLSTPVAAPNWNETRSRLKGAATAVGIPAVARAAKSAWAEKDSPRRKDRARSARAPRSAERAPAAQQSKAQQSAGFLGELAAELAADRSQPPPPLQASSATLALALAPALTRQAPPLEARLTNPSPNPTSGATAGQS